MKITHHLVAASLFAIAGVAVAQQPEAPVAVNVEGLPQDIRARIEEKAKEGPTALIRYLQRTRHIHHLRPLGNIKCLIASHPGLGAGPRRHLGQYPELIAHLDQRFLEICPR